VGSRQSINTIAELRLIFMLFMIGLEIDLKIVRAGSVILVTSAAQIWVALRSRSGSFSPSAFRSAIAASTRSIAVAVAPDTVIIVSCPTSVSSTRFPDVTLGVLVVQDLFAILFLAIQPSLNDVNFDVVLVSVLRVGVLLVTALVFSRYTLPHLFRLIASLPELVLVGALAWCFAVAEFAEFLGLSREMGALIAGVSLSTFPYALDSPPR
jgi:Kef-type K+ transport system membrane component KefB